MTKPISDVVRYDITVDLRNIRLDQCSFNHLRFRFIQREHRGGFCDCWAVANLTATLTSGEVKDLRYIRLFLLLICVHNIIRITNRKFCSSSTQAAADLLFFENDPLAHWGATTGFCQDSASVMRVFQTQSGSDSRDDNDMKICDIEANSPYAVNNCDDQKM